jgi:hypothetical protein
VGIPPAAVRSREMAMTPQTAELICLQRLQRGAIKSET